MKSFIAICIIFAIMLGGVIFNCLYINRTCDTLAAMTQALPQADCSECRNMVARLDEYWQSHHATIALSVSYIKLNRISDLLSALKSYAESGAASDYECARALLLNAISEIR